MNDQKVLIIICVERGYLENMAKLLIHSLQIHGGQFKNAKIIAYQPREGHHVSHETLNFYKDNDVECISDNLNKNFIRYPIANKVFACAHAEKHFPSYKLIFLDTDIFFVSEPKLFADVSKNKVFVKPVDIKNVGSNYNDDDNTGYWKSIYRTFKIQKEKYVLTSVSRERILQYFNAGHIMSHGENGFYKKWKDNFLKLVELRMFPKQGIFFIDQITLALTISKENYDLNILPHEYNYPIHRRNQMEPELRLKTADQIVNAHYHKMFTFGKNPVIKYLDQCENGKTINTLIEKYNIVQVRKNKQ